MSQAEDLPRDTRDLLARIQKEWDRLQSVVAGLDERRLTQADAGGWSIKDNLAHVAAWETYLRLHYLGGRPAHEVMGIERKLYESLDEDGVNDILFQRHRGESVAEVLERSRTVHAQVLADLERIPFARLMKLLDPKDPEAGPLIRWVIGNTYDHYKEHRLNIERALRS